MLKLGPISFQGKLMRQTEYVRCVGKKETSREDLIRSYDSQIEKINAYKQFALKLDDIMHADKDIKKKIESLPDDVEIEVAGKLTLGECTSDEIELISPQILADGIGLDCDDCIYLDASEEEPDKEEILDWLDCIEEKVKQR